jgi:hypothetical protein
VRVTPRASTALIVTVTIRAVDSRGIIRSLVYLIPVGGGGTTSTTDGIGTQSLRRSGAVSTGKGVRYEHVARIPDAELPAVVHQIQAAIPDDATEQALLAELVAAPHSALAVDYDVSNGTLAVNVRPIESSEGTGRGQVAASALGLASGGLLVLRRRNVRINGGAR